MSQTVYIGIPGTGAGSTMRSLAWTVDLANSMGPCSCYSIYVSLKIVPMSFCWGLRLYRYLWTHWANNPCRYAVHTWASKGLPDHDFGTMPTAWLLGALRLCTSHRGLPASSSIGAPSCNPKGRHLLDWAVKVFLYLHFRV